MKRNSYSISDWFFGFMTALKRNKTAVVIYSLVCLVFLIVGIAVGVNVEDKSAYIINGNAVVFGFLRGDNGIAAFFFISISATFIYCLFAASAFFNKATDFLSVVPCCYKAYVLGLEVSIIIAVYSVSALPMLFVVYIPACLIEILILCVTSFKCFLFTAMNCGVLPSKSDLKVYYADFMRCMLFVAVTELAKSITLVLFGSALIGIV